MEGASPQAQAGPVRVLIADDHRLFADALEALLAADPRIEVVGVADDGRKAVDASAELQPDIVLMDISMPVMDGFEATEALSAAPESPRILMLTGSNSRSDVDRARQAGAAGYVTKDRISDELIETILEIAAT